MMHPTRREALARLSSASLTSGAFLTAASCSTRPDQKSIAKIALLSPLTGPRSEVGKSIERAARLSLPPNVLLRVLDTTGSPDGARSAMKQLATFQPDLIIGPASSEEAAAVSSSVPMLTLSNDDTLQSSGLFVMGVTARQSTDAVLAYARKAGVRTFALVRSGSSWSARCESAARLAADRLGMRMLAAIDLPTGNLVEALVAVGAGELPNAVLLPEATALAGAPASAILAAKLQILGTNAWSSAEVSLPHAAGAWIAAPDPQASARFAAAYTAKFGESPGIIAGLAYDAGLAVVTLARAGNVSREALMRSEGFSGVTGMFRFTPEMRAERRLAVLVATPEGGRPVDGEAMAWS